MTDTYEPGSTFKVVTVGGVLEESLVTPATQFTLPYKIQVADRVIHDALPRGTETMTVSQILSRSSNVGVVTLALQLQRDRLDEWIRRFGFGRKTGVDFPGESPGHRPAPGGVVGLDDRQRADRAGHRGDAAADGGRLRRDRERRRLAAAAPRRPGRGRASAWRPKRRQVLSAETAPGADARCCAASSRRAPGRRPRSTATASPARRAPRRSRSRPAATRTRATSPRSSASRPASRPRVVVARHRGRAAGRDLGRHRRRARVFAEIAQFVLQYLEVPPDARRAPSSRPHRLHARARVAGESAR